MPIERSGIYKIGSKPVTIIGRDVEIGTISPEFTSTALDWTRVNWIRENDGFVRVIASLPSLDTSVCDREIRRFNQEAASLDKDIKILAISTDLPYAQNRWCGASGVDQVQILSDHMAGEFGEKYGTLIKELRILRRAVFVVDRSRNIVYAEYMPTLGDEPDYDAVLKAAGGAL